MAPSRPSASKYHQQFNSTIPTTNESASGTRFQVGCVVCGSCRSRLVTSVDDLAAQQQYLELFYRRRWRRLNRSTAEDRLSFTQNYTTNVASCLECGLLFRHPHPSQDTIIRTYETDRYDKAYLWAEFRAQRAWAHRKIHPLARRLSHRSVRSAPRVLEIGSFVGGFLEEGRSRGWEMLGVDPGEAVIDFCRARGLPVLHGTIEEAKLAPSSFDAVVIWNTFDQLPDPHSTLMSIVRVLRSGGLCVIRVPNGACFEGAMRILPQLPSWLRWPLQTALAWNNMLTFPYLYGYSPDTLARLTAAYGFRVVACIPDTIAPVPAHQLKPWAEWEERCYQWMCRLGWQAARREGFRTPLRPAPWLDFYLERAATDDELPDTESAGLGLIPVYEPLAFNQTSNRSQT